MGSFHKTESDILGQFGPVWQFRVQDFLRSGISCAFYSYFSRIQFRQGLLEFYQSLVQILTKQAKNDVAKNSLDRRTFIKMTWVHIENTFVCEKRGRSAINSRLRRSRPAPYPPLLVCIPDFLEAPVSMDHSFFRDNP